MDNSERERGEREENFENARKLNILQSMDSKTNIF